MSNALALAAVLAMSLSGVDLGGARGLGPGVGVLRGRGHRASTQLAR